MAIYKGSTEITPGNLHLGDQEVQEVYVGSTKVWENSTTHVFARGTVAGSKVFTMLLTPGIEGLKLTSGGKDVPIPSVDGYWEVTLPNIYFEVTYESVSDPEAYISFAAETMGGNDITSVEIVDLTDIYSLYYLVARCQAFSGDKPVVFSTSTSHILNMKNAFYGTRGLYSIPDNMDFSNVKDLGGFAQTCEINGLEINAPNALNMDYMCNCESYQGSPQGVMDYVIVNAPMCTSWQKAFNDIRGLVGVEIVMGRGVALNTREMFRYAGRDSTICINGYLDTTVATDTNSMFAASNIMYPNMTQQDELEDGGTYEYSGCS